MEKIKHIAPTEKIELAIVNYCVETLGLEFGEFWYKWFDSNKEDNHSLQIECDVAGLVEKIRKTLKQHDDINVVSFYELREIPLPDYCENRYQYNIHFKKEPLL